MWNVDHCGNTGSVGGTCFYAYGITDNEREALTALGCHVGKGSKCYVFVAIAKWAGVRAYLKLLGHDVPALPRKLYTLGHKVHEWEAAGYEIPDDVYWELKGDRS